MINIKITLNGIKVNGNYIPCSFSIDDNSVMVYAREYGRNTLPAELGTVRNDTDSREDYFETDHVRVFPQSEFYKACYRAAVNAKIKSCNYQIRYCEKQLVKYPHGYYFDMYTKELAETKASLTKWQTVFENCKAA